MFRLVLVLAFANIAFGVPKAKCPQLDGKIVGGEPVAIEDYPYQLSLMFQGSHICGASIISPNFVITAAHCTNGINPSDLSVRAGSANHNEGGVVATISTITQHPLYDALLLDYDVSILELTAPLIFGFAIQSVDLPSEDTPFPVGQIGDVSGWGVLAEETTDLATILQGVSIPVKSKDSCLSSYPDQITDRMFCAGSNAGGKDACSGDSGSPFVIGGKIIGIVSWGLGCARPDYPGVYTYIPSVRDFIFSITGE